MRESNVCYKLFIPRPSYYCPCIGTDGQPPFTDGKLDLPSVPSVPMGKDFERYFMPWYNVKAPKNITDVPMVYICPSVRTDNLHLPTVNWIYHRYRWTRFSRATSCVGIMSRHQRIVQMYRWYTFVHRYGRTTSIYRR